ncbi:MAG: ubiquinone biosynthesis protein [Betaproteobacteria bacterium]|nr:ubiquinone biosynthesis protein [Betaproteobacteria bacterium]
MVLDPAAIAFVNHLLRGASWARDEIKRFAGRTARFEAAPFALSLTVLDSGEVAAAAAEEVPAVTVRLTPGLLLRLAARDKTVWREIEAAGDADFAAAVNHVAHNLRWDIEEDLSRVFGDIAAHRMAETGRTLRRWGDQALENTGRSFAEYWTEEQPLIAAARDLDQFNRAVDQLRDDVARAEKRIDQLVKRRGAGSNRDRD